MHTILFAGRLLMGISITGLSLRMRKQNKKIWSLGLIFGILLLIFAILGWLFGES
jgi:hypothetical protein